MGAKRAEEAERIAEARRAEEERLEMEEYERAVEMRRAEADRAEAAGATTTNDCDGAGYPSKVLEAPVKQKPKPKPKPVIESKWASSVPTAEQDGTDEQEDSVGIAGPSLMDAVSAPVKEKKTAQPPPEPKKKGKQKMAKMDLGALGFDF